MFTLCTIEQSRMFSHVVTHTHTHTYTYTHEVFPNPISLANWTIGKFQLLRCYQTFILKFSELHIVYMTTYICRRFLRRETYSILNWWCGIILESDSTSPKFHHPHRPKYFHCMKLFVFFSYKNKIMYDYNSHVDWSLNALTSRHKPLTLGLPCVSTACMIYLSDYTTLVYTHTHLYIYLKHMHKYTNIRMTCYCYDELKTRFDTILSCKTLTYTCMQTQTCCSLCRVCVCVCKFQCLNQCCFFYSIN